MPGTDQPGALPFDLAFDRREFLWDAGPAASPGGGMVAYSVRQPPTDVNLDARYQRNGTPSSAVGSRVYLSEAAGGAAVDVCPRQGNCWRPSWSPDGKRLAFYSDAGGWPQLWVYDLTEGKPRRLSDARIKAKLWAGDEARWSPDGQTLYVPLAPDQSADADYSSFSGGGTGGGAATTEEVAATEGPTVTVLRSGREVEEVAEKGGPDARTAFYLFENNAAMAAIDAIPGEVRVLVPAETTARPSLLRISPSGRWLSYLSVFKAGAVTSQQNTYDLAVVPTRGGPVRVLAEDLPVGRDYHQQNYSWHPTADRLVYLKDKKLFVVDLGADGPGEPHRLGSDLGELAPVPMWFTRAGDAVVVGIDPLDYQDYFEERPRGLAVVPLDGAPPVPVPFGDEWVYEGILKANATTLWQPVEDSLTVLLKDVASGETAVVRFGYGGSGAEVLWKRIAGVRGFTSGGSHESIFAFYEDVGTPPDVYRFDGSFSTMERVSKIEDRLDDVAKPKAEIIEVTVPLFDGELAQVRTGILLPPGAKRGDRLPGIVVIYPGGDVSRHVERFGGGSSISVPTLLFVSRGLAVVLVHLQLGPNAEAGNPMQEMVDALLPQVYRAAERGYVDIERLGIAGQSFGGYGTASIISRTNLFRAAVAISGIYDLGGTYGHLGGGQNSFWIGWSEGGQARMGTHPWANLRRYIDNSPYYQADKIRTPLLIVHGDQDMAYHDGEKLFTALRRLNCDAQLAIYHGQGHVISSWTRANAIDASERMVGFFAKHLGGLR